MVTEYPDVVLRCWRLRVEQNSSSTLDERHHLGNGLSRTTGAILSSEEEQTGNGSRDRNNSDLISCRSSAETLFSECTDGITRGMKDECESSSGNCNAFSFRNRSSSNDDSSRKKVECRNSIVSIGRNENNGTKEEKVAMQSKTASSHEGADHGILIKKSCKLELRKEKQVGLFKDDSIVVTLVEINDDLADPKAYLWIGERVPESKIALSTDQSTLDELSRRIAQRCGSPVHQNSPIEIIIVYQSQEPQDMLRALNTCKGGWGIIFIRERTSDSPSDSPYRVIELEEKYGVAVALELVRKDRIGDVIRKGRTNTSAQIVFFPFPSKVKSYIVVQGTCPVYMWHSSEESTSVGCLGRHICENAAYLFPRRQNTVLPSCKDKRGKKSKRKKAASPELLHLWGGEASVSPPPPKLFWEAMGLEVEGRFPVEEPCLPTTLTTRDCIDVAAECSSHSTHIEAASRSKTSTHQLFQGKTGGGDPQENSTGENGASCKIKESAASHVHERGTQQPLTLDNGMDDNVEETGEVKSSTMDVESELSFNRADRIRNGSNPDIWIVDNEGTTQYQGTTLDKYVVDDYVDIISSKSVMVDGVHAKPKRTSACGKKRETLMTAAVECGVDDGIKNVGSSIVEHQMVDGAAVATLDGSLLQSYGDAPVTESSAASKRVQRDAIGIETTEEVVDSKVVVDAIDFDGVSVNNLVNAKARLLTTPNDSCFNANIGCCTDTTGVDGQRGKLGGTTFSTVDGRRRSSSQSAFILDEPDCNTSGIKLNEIQQQLSPQPPRCEGKRDTTTGVLARGQQVGASSNAISPQCNGLGRPNFLLDVVKHHCLLDVSKCKSFSSNEHEMKEVGAYNTVVNEVSGALSSEAVPRLRCDGEVLPLQPSVNTGTINVVTESEREIERVIFQESVDDGTGTMNIEQRQTQNADACDDESAATAPVNASKEQLESIHYPTEDDRDQNEVSDRVRNTRSASTKKSPSMTNKTNVMNHDDCGIVQEVPDPISNSPEAPPKMPRRGSNSAVERARALADIDRCRREEQRVLNANANGFMDQVQDLVATITHGGRKGSCAIDHRKGNTTINQSHQTLSRRGSVAHEPSRILDIRSDSTPMKEASTLSRRTSSVYHSPAPLTPTRIDLNYANTKPTIWEAWNPGRSDLKVPLPATIPEIPGSFELFLDWHKICCAQGFG